MKNNYFIYTEEERREAIAHLSKALLAVWLYEINPSSTENRAKRAAICDKLSKWRKGTSV